jgi:hypothetical protein
LKAAIALLDFSLLVTCQVVFKNVSSGTGKVIVFVAPAGIEKFFEELSEFAQENPGPPDLKAVTAIAEKYDIEILLQTNS